MTMFEAITRTPERFIDWLMANKEAICIDPAEGLYAGIETAMVLTNDPDDDDQDEGMCVDAATLKPDVADEIRHALMMILSTEVDDDGNPIDV